MNTEWKKFSALVAIFLTLYFIPLYILSENGIILPEILIPGLSLLQEYIREHTLTCLLPAFFIAGAISVFVKKDSILQLLGPSAKKYISYPVASLSGGILAVCSCTILPLFAGIYKRGAGIGPAVAFLFTGPAINITAIFLTGNAIGWDFAIGRIIASIIIAIIAGIIISLVFSEQNEGTTNNFASGQDSEISYSDFHIAAFVGIQLFILILFSLRFQELYKFLLIGAALVFLLYLINKKNIKEDNIQWMLETWNLAKKILPFLFIGVFFAGIAENIIPKEWIKQLVGENNLSGNLVASLSGSLMYFATLTEVPIIETLMKMGMARGPAMTLFLTGNSLSIPGLLVLLNLIGVKKTLTYLLLIITLSTLAGMLFGNI